MPSRIYPVTLVRDMCFGSVSSSASLPIQSVPSSDLSYKTTTFLIAGYAVLPFDGYRNRPSVANVHHSQSQKCFLDRSYQRKSHSRHDTYIYIATIIKASSSSDASGDMDYQSMATHSKRGIHIRPWECTDGA